MILTPEERLRLTEIQAELGEVGYMRKRGHLVVDIPSRCPDDYPEECAGPWWWADDLTSAEDGVERSCPSCGLTALRDGPDPCMGMIPGVSHACCGHGELSECYLVTDDGERYKGKRAVTKMTELALNHLVSERLAQAKAGEAVPISDIFAEVDAEP